MYARPRDPDTLIPIENERNAVEDALTIAFLQGRATAQQLADALEAEIAVERELVLALRG
jgi:hypothetical protein